MERKTQISAEDGKQELVITREFDLPVGLLFRAHAEAEILGQWMGTNVVKLESKKHGSYQFETAGPKGNIVFRAGGVIHEFSPHRKIIRTFEIENGPFGVQLELLEFEKLSEGTSKLTTRFIYESVALRDRVLKSGMSHGINLAHDRLQEIVAKLK